MHPLHDYISKQLAEKLKARKVVVWYDVRREFAPFIAEMRGGARTSDEAVPVTVGGIAARLTEYDGSMFELRAVVEPFVCGDAPAECVIVYLPGCERDRHGSVLMELEKAGDCYEPQLKRLARNVLRQRYTDGVIDEMLAPERVSYEDLARASSDTSSTEPPSVLKSIFHSTSGNDGIIASWLASDERDAEIEAKEAIRELVKLVRSKLGLELPDDAALPKLRSITLRYVLAGEFRSDLSCAPPSALDAVPAPKTKDEEAAVGELARLLRTRFSEVYPAMADRVEAELGLRDAAVPAGALGSIDTFRFEERALLAHCGDLVAAKKFDQALEIIGGREHSFWLDRDVGRKAQWEACRRMAELGSLGVAVRAAVRKGRRRRQCLDRRLRRPRTVGSDWTRLSGVLRHGSRTSTTNRRSARSASFEASTKTPAARWPMALRKPSSRPSGRSRRPCTKRASTARSSRSSQSPSRISSSTPCVSRWASNSPSGFQNLRKSASVLPSARCPASRRLAWPHCSQGHRQASALSSRPARSARGSTTHSFPTLPRGRNSPPRACPSWPTSLWTSC